MPPIFDFSNAGSWVAGGFIAGLLAYWLLRSLFGGNGRRAEELAKFAAQIDAANEQLTVLRGDSEIGIANARYYEGEFNKQFAMSQSLSQEAAKVPCLKTDLEAARIETENSRAEAIEAAAELEKIKQEKIARLQAHLDSTRSVERVFKQEMNSLKLQLTQLAEELEAAKSEIEGWRHRVAELQASKDRYDSEIARLTAELKAAQTAAAQAELLQGEVTRLTDEFADFKSSTALDLLEGAKEKSRLSAEAARLTAALHSAYADLRHTLNEFASFKSSSASNLQGGGVEESNRLGAEVERLRATLHSAYADLRHTIHEFGSFKSGAVSDLQASVEEKDRLGSEVARVTATLHSTYADLRHTSAELHSAKRDLREIQEALEATSSLVVSRSNEIEQLKVKLAAVPADVDTFRRYKEALDVANRIAAGLHEKV